MGQPQLSSAGTGFAETPGEGGGRKGWAGWCGRPQEAAVILYMSYEEVRALRQGARSSLRDEP